MPPARIALSDDVTYSRVGVSNASPSVVPPTNGAGEESDAPVIATTLRTNE